MLNADIKNIEILSMSFEHVLQRKIYNLKEMEREWEKVDKRKLSEKIPSQSSFSILPKSIRKRVFSDVFRRSRKWVQRCFEKRFFLKTK